MDVLSLLAETWCSHQPEGAPEDVRTCRSIGSTGTKCPPCDVEVLPCPRC